MRQVPYGVSCITVGRREQILAGRKVFEIRTLVARREHYRQSVKNQAAQESGTPGV